MRSCAGGVRSGLPGTPLAPVERGAPAGIKATLEALVGPPGTDGSLDPKRGGASNRAWYRTVRGGWRKKPQSEPAYGIRKDKKSRLLVPRPDGAACDSAEESVAEPARGRPHCFVFDLGADLAESPSVGLRRAAGVGAGPSKKKKKSRVPAGLLPVPPPPRPPFAGTTGSPSQDVAEPY